MKELTIICPDDWHCHLRDHEFLERTVADIAARFQRAIIMPNLKPPVTTVEAASHYLERIRAKVPQGSQFQPLMTLYLTPDMSPKTIMAAKTSGFIVAFKLYPAGATTHSEAGVSDLNAIYPLIAAIRDADMPLLIHGESITPGVDIFDREAQFIDTELNALIKTFPTLRIVLEHISTRAAVEFIKAAPDTVAATITPHHLLYDRNVIFQGGICPHYYCLPILKRATDQAALIEAAISGHPRFFLGTDSAPHVRSRKESSCGCAGIYNAHAAIELYAEVFAAHNALAKLEGFASRHGAEFYRLPLNQNTITLIPKPWKVADTLSFGHEHLVPLRAGESINWQIMT